MSRTQLAIYSPSGGGRTEKCTLPLPSACASSSFCHIMTLAVFPFAFLFTFWTFFRLPPPDGL